ncbi:MAG: pantetheine-phosphate adenylyltransferase [Bacteroidetes bacterium]|nr:pantetheine-phosphate adenylyltransferase [Bacteroidota bacterium]
MRIAVFPGSFDPITIGHQDIIERASTLFDKMIVGIGTNANKQHMFTLEQRVSWIEKTFEANSNISVAAYSGLTIDFCKKNNANYLVRGLRSFTDFEYESAIAQMNHKMSPVIETIFMLTKPEYDAIASTIVRDIIRNGGEVKQFLARGVSLGV